MIFKANTENAKKIWWYPGKIIILIYVLFVFSGGLSEDDLMKIWKGLHYCMWMQDKPLIQVPFENLNLSLYTFIFTLLVTEEIAIQFNFC